VFVIDNEPANIQGSLVLQIQCECLSSWERQTRQLTAPRSEMIHQYLSLGFRCFGRKPFGRQTFDRHSVCSSKLSPCKIDRQVCLYDVCRSICLLAKMSVDQSKCLSAKMSFGQMIFGQKTWNRRLDGVWPLANKATHLKAPPISKTSPPFLRFVARIEKTFWKNFFLERGKEKLLTNTKTCEICYLQIWGRIHNILFSSWLRNGPN